MIKDGEKSIVEGSSDDLDMATTTYCFIAFLAKSIS